jgi:hypothetical protein
VSVLEREDELILQRVMKGNKNSLEILTKNLYVGEFSKFYEMYLMG